MSAKDYRICPAIFNAYIAKVSKRDPNVMLDDRREIPEEEILCLIHWWLKKKCEDTEIKTHVITANGKSIIELTLLDDSE